MPVLQLDDRQFPLGAGSTRVGAGADADLSLPTDATLGVQAVIEGGQSGKPLVIRRAGPASAVRVNGVSLGAEPTPLMHGDKVEIGGLELFYAEDAKAGATQFLSSSRIDALAGAPPAGAPRATAASGGRLVSLVDGKEYHVPASGIVMGRDASCDVVVAQREVSRRHAEIAPADEGYTVRDTSANGVFVNGARVQGSQRLARADVVRIGVEEFRFYADVLAAAAVPGAAAVEAAAPRRVAPVTSLEPPTAPLPRATLPEPSLPDGDFDLLPAIVSPLAPTPVVAHSSVSADQAARPAVAAPRPAHPPDQRSTLATLERLNEGPDKGNQYPLRTSLVHVGRGAHNDLQLGDESVSETHAKLQRREDGWYLVDMESTNGSYAGGVRVRGEQRIDGASDLRFGGVKMRFTPLVGEAAVVEGGGTRAIASVDRQRVASPPSNAPEPATSSGMTAVLVIIVAVAVVAAAFFVLRGRA